MASVRAVEDALKLDIPPNAQFIRNIILISHAMHDHIVHFYHLSALDFVDVSKIPAADPKTTASLAESLSPWQGNSMKTMKSAQDKVNAVLASGPTRHLHQRLLGSTRRCTFAPDVNLLAFAHYLQALEYQRKALQVTAILGGKTPHIQNLAVGGVMNAINPDSLGTLTEDRLQMLKSLIDEVVPFIHQVYLPDVCAIAAMYPEWFRYGRGVANYLAVPDLPLNAKADQFDLPGGYISDGSLASVRRFQTAADDPFRKAVTEDVTHAWYKGSKPLHPYEGETEPEYTDLPRRTGNTVG